MTVIRKKVQKMLYRLGFTGVMRLNDNDLRELAMRAVTQIPREDVPDRYHPTYDAVRKFARRGEYFEWARGIRKPKKNEQVHTDKRV